MKSGKFDEHGKHIIAGNLRGCDGDDVAGSGSFGRFLQVAMFVVLDNRFLFNKKKVKD